MRSEWNTRREREKKREQSRALPQWMERSFYRLELLLPLLGRTFPPLFFYDSERKILVYLKYGVRFRIHKIRYSFFFFLFSFAVVLYVFHTQCFLFSSSCVTLSPRAKGSFRHSISLIIFSSTHSTDSPGFHNTHCSLQPIRTAYYISHSLFFLLTYVWHETIH